jgi:hypothetical protein
MAKKVTKKESPKINPDNLAQFVARHNNKMRVIIDTVSRYDAADVDRKTMEALSPSVPMQARAKAAFEILAWNHLIRPYAHPSRQYSVNLEPYRELVEKSAEALYMYAITVDKEPSKDTLKKLKALHPQIAKDYEEYCANYSAALKEIDHFSTYIAW